MAYEPGAQLGAFEILSAVTACGMREVSKAKDARLDRKVALKVLAPDPSRRALPLEQALELTRPIASSLEALALEIMKRTGIE